VKGLLVFYPDKEIDLASNVDEIQVGVKAEDLDAAVRAPCTEDDGLLHGPCGAVQGADPPGDGQVRHEEEHEGDERERRKDDEQDAAVLMDAVGERDLATVGSAE
jgi:hypothetical protein